MSLVQPIPKFPTTMSLVERHTSAPMLEPGPLDPMSIGELTVMDMKADDLRPEPNELTARHYQSAFELLDCAAQALEVLRDRRDKLEISLKEVSARAESVISAAQGKASGWQQLVAELKAQNQEMERRLAAMQQRAEFSEDQVYAERTRADEAGRRAFDAQAVAQGLYMKIMTTFAQGSKARDALASVWDTRPKHDLPG